MGKRCFGLVKCARSRFQQSLIAKSSRSETQTGFTDDWELVGRQKGKPEALYCTPARTEGVVFMIRCDRHEHCRHQVLNGRVGRQ